MIQHEKYLFRFVSLFKEADSNKDGIINEHQFKYLINEMKIIPQSIASNEDRFDEEVERLLMMIDPHKTQQITFSELVTFLTLTEFNEISENKSLHMQKVKEKGGEDNEESQNISLTLLDKINKSSQ